VLQKEQLGTGHAVACARETLAGFNGTVLILCGDTPCCGRDAEGTDRAPPEPEGGGDNFDRHLDVPYGYGRIVRDDSGAVLRIVEQKDATPGEQAIREINSGIYCMDAAFLFDNIDNVGATTPSRSST